MGCYRLGCHSGEGHPTHKARADSHLRSGDPGKSTEPTRTFRAATASLRRPDHRAGGVHAGAPAAHLALECSRVVTRGHRATDTFDIRPAAARRGIAPGNGHASGTASERTCFQCSTPAPKRDHCQVQCSYRFTACRAETAAGSVTSGRLRIGCASSRRLLRARPARGAGEEPAPGRTRAFCHARFKRAGPMDHDAACIAVRRPARSTAQAWQ